MIVRTPVSRIPIKIRKSIVRDFCSCWGLTVLAIDGLPHLVIGDGASHSDIKNFLDSVDCCTGFYFSEPEEDCASKISLVSEYGLPITLRTDKRITDGMMAILASLPHSAIHVSMESSRNFLPFSVRLMLSEAKSLKVVSAVQIEYKPHLTKKLNLLDSLDSVKNYISHVLVSYPDIDDIEYNRVKSQWEQVSPGAVESFKHYYMPDVHSRSWTLKPRYRQEITSMMDDYLKPRKVTLEVVGDSKASSNRVRLDYAGLSSNPLGMRPFLYKKEDGRFVETHNFEGHTCPKCNLNIF